jgi:hypothetical protein
MFFQPFVWAMRQTKTALTARQVEPCLYLQFGTLGWMNLVGHEQSNLTRGFDEGGVHWFDSPVGKLALQH